MPIKIDLKNKRFERLVCLREVGRKNGHVLWLCKCDCGGKIETISSSLLNGKTKSCGCLLNESRIKNHTSHGLSSRNGKKTPLYSVWLMMRQRCLNKKNKYYKRYGGRGIYICEKWNDYAVFYEWAIENGYKKRLTIERKDNNGPYDPKNCKWTTYKEQGRNTRRNRLISFCGKTKTLVEWGETIGLSTEVIRQRIDRYGWSVKKALTTPKGE